MRASRGSILVIIMLVATVLMFFMAIVGANAAFNLRASTDLANQKRARYAAYSGLQRAMGELVVDPGWPGAGHPWGGPVNGALPGEPQLVYSVQVFNNSTGLSIRDASDGVPVAPGAVYLISEGQDSLRASSHRAVSAMAGTAVRTRASFDQAAFGETALKLNNTAVDAWEGGKDPYKPEDKSPTDGDLVTNGAMTLSSGSMVDGDVWAPNAPEPPLIDTDGDGIPETPEGVTLDATSSYTGLRQTQTAPGGPPLFVSPYPPDMATFSVTPTNLPPSNNNNNNNNGGGNNNNGGGGNNNGNGNGNNGGGGNNGGNNNNGGGGNNNNNDSPSGPRLKPGAYRDLTIAQNETLVLEAGVYYFKDFVKVDAGELAIDSSKGPVIIYVGQDMELLNGADVNKEGMPADLQVYFTDEKAAPAADPTLPAPPPFSRLSVQGDSIASMVAAGQSTVVEVGSADPTAPGPELFGAVMGKNVNLSNAKMHYDMTLKGMPLGGASRWSLEGVVDLGR